VVIEGGNELFMAAAARRIVRDCVGEKCGDFGETLCFCEIFRQFLETLIMPTITKEGQKTKLRYIQVLVGYRKFDQKCHTNFLGKKRLSIKSLKMPEAETKKTGIFTSLFSMLEGISKLYSIEVSNWSY
jgi:hypothetical protein